VASHTNDRPTFRPRPPTSAHNDALLLVQRVALHQAAFDELAHYAHLAA